MARKTTLITIEDEGRDFGKAFLITEMSASKAEAWATRVLLALVASNVNLPPRYEELGTAGLAEMGLRAIGGLSWETAQPLLAEMLTCIQAIPTPARPEIRRPLIEEDIEEVSTRLKLRVEVWKLHFDFFSQGGLSSLLGSTMKAATTTPPTATSAE